MDLNEGKGSSISRQLEPKYTNLKEVSRTSYYTIFEGTSRTENVQHLITVLDVNSQFYQSNPEAASALFMSENSYLNNRLQDSQTLVTDDTVSEDKAFIFAAKSKSSQLESLNSGSHSILNGQREEIIGQLESEINHLLTAIGFPHVYLSSNNVFLVKSSGKVVVCDWAQCSTTLPEQKDHCDQNCFSLPSKREGVALSLVPRKRAEIPT